MYRTESISRRSRALAPAALLLLAFCLLAGSAQASYIPGIQRYVVGDVLEITGADGPDRSIVASVDTTGPATRNYTAYGVVQNEGRWEIPRFWHQELDVDEPELVENLHARRAGHVDPVIVIITDATVTGGGMQYAGLSLAEALAGTAYPVAPAPGEPSPSSPLYLQGDISGEHWLIGGVTTDSQPEPLYSTYSVFQHGDRWYIEKYWHGNDNFPESWLREHNFTRTHHADPHTIIINETTLTGGDIGYWRYSLAELGTIGGYPAENWQDQPTLMTPARYNVGDILGNDTSPARYVVGAVELLSNQYPLYTAYPVVRNGTGWDIPSFGHGVFFRADALQVYELAMHRLDHTDPHFAIVTDPEIASSNLYCYGLSLGEILDGVHGYPAEDPVGPFPTPYRPHSLPGRIEAEDYDLGGEGAAYHDTTPGNAGGAYRNDDVDIETGNGVTNVGWIQDGEWLTYTVNVTEAGSYGVTASVASPNGNRTVSLSVDDQYPMTLTVPNTGSFGTFAPALVPIVCWDPPTGFGSCDPVPIVFSAGTHTLRLAFHGDGQNIDWIEFTPVPGPASTVKEVPGGVDVPTDTDGDGKYDDVNGNQATDFNDLVLYFYQLDWIIANEPLSAFDYNGNGGIDFADIVWLFDHMGTGPTVYTVMAAAVGPGEIAPAGNVTVREGENITFSLISRGTLPTPYDTQSGYVVRNEVRVDPSVVPTPYPFPVAGGSWSFTPSYTLADVRANHTVYGVFSYVPVTC